MIIHGDGVPLGGQVCDGKANKEVSLSLATFREQGARIIFGGGLNAHTGANGDTTEIDAAGRKLIDTMDHSVLMLINTTPCICTGGPTRTHAREDGTQQSTLDCVMYTPDLAPLLKSLTDGTMG
jgi:hypothetical protein